MQSALSISLGKIHGFLAVAEAGQFRKAAEKLHLSQAALSTQIRDLERDLGVALFMRTTRSVALTAEGDRFRYRAQRILDELESAITEVRDQVELRDGRLIIAATPSVATNILPAALVAFRHAYPGVRVHIVEDQSAGVESQVEAGEVDFGIGPLANGRTDLAFSFVLTDRFIGVVAANHPLARRKRVSLSQLLKYTLLTTTPQTSIRRSLESIAGERRNEIHTEHSFVQHQTVVAMVAAGIGVALLPSLALALIDRSQIVLLEVHAPVISREIGVLQRRGGNASSAVTAFLPFLTAH
jgi:LysR family transcriptional regulator, carnitine catabolism transcriptional activator